METAAGRDLAALVRRLEARRDELGQEFRAALGEGDYFTAGLVEDQLGACENELEHFRRLNGRASS